MGARLKFWRRSRVPKKGSRDEAVEIYAVFLAASPLVTAPPSNLTRLYYNGSAAKSHSTTTQYRQLRRLGHGLLTLHPIGVPHKCIPRVLSQIYTYQTNFVYRYFHCFTVSGRLG